MSKRPDFSSIAAFPAALALAGCVNTRVYSEEELALVATRCGVAQGEVMQDAEYPRILFLMATDVSLQQFRCVRSWSRRRGMHLSRIQGIEFQE
jgi:hypothetical protein